MASQYKVVNRQISVDSKTEVATINKLSRVVENKVTLVIPAYNEENSIIDQISSVKMAMNETHWSYEIIVVDDGSTDSTPEKAAQDNVRVLKSPQNRGYGAALKLGISHAETEYIVIIDADGTYPAESIPQLLDKAADYDMVVGARIGINVNIPSIRKPAKWFLRHLASYLAGQKIPDLNSGLRVLKKSVVEKFFHILPSGFSFTTTITLACLCNNLLVYYHPIEYAERIGNSKIRPMDAYHFLLLILRTIVFFNPLKVFLPLGAFFFLIGLGKFIYDLFIGNLSETAVMGFLGGFIIWAMGLLSDQIARFSVGIKSH